MSDSFHINGRAGKFGDVLKTYNWQVSFSSHPGNTDGDDMTFKARSAAIPGTTINNIESSFMGMKQHFAGNATLEHTLAIEFEEFEDSKVLKYLTNWQEFIFSTQKANSSGDLGGKSASTGKNTGAFPYSTTATLTLYKANGEASNTKINFHNCWLQSFTSVSLAYGDAGSVKYPATFYWDWYEVVNS